MFGIFFLRIRYLFRSKQFPSLPKKRYFLISFFYHNEQVYGISSVIVSKFNVMPTGYEALRLCEKSLSDVEDMVDVNISNISELSEKDFLSLSEGFNQTRDIRFDVAKKSLNKVNLN